MLDEITTDLTSICWDERQNVILLEMQIMVVMPQNKRLDYYKLTHLTPPLGSKRAQGLVRTPTLSHLAELHKEHHRNGLKNVPDALQQ
ncbi:hypothetical protein scyTo_0000302 [Scyliorhinus torazame]|uniref:Uncharacterized protein n=1 Tax=Scyliorhinus torazame TaxID=75743 RepID=A0A401NUS1_SCYTO|nr:hypothetical protein [Scyliorhinus torazame]